MIRTKSRNDLELTIRRLIFLKHSSLRLIGSRLYVIQGKPEEQIPLLVAKWGVELLTFEKDTEPYAVLRDTSMMKSLAKGVKVSSVCSHTLYETEHYLATNGGKIPTTYVAFCKLFLSMSSMRQPIETITSMQVTTT
jgi:cryptochrome